MKTSIIKCLIYNKEFDSFVNNKVTYYSKYGITGVFNSLTIKENDILISIIHFDIASEIGNGVAIVLKKKLNESTFTNNRRTK